MATIIVRHVSFVLLACECCGNISSVPRSHMGSLICECGSDDWSVVGVANADAFSGDE